MSDLKIKTLYVGNLCINYIQVTKQNLEDAAKWCGGSYIRHPSEDVVEVNTPSGVMFAFPGYYILKYPDGTKEVRNGNTLKV